MSAAALRSSACTAPGLGRARPKTATPRLPRCVGSARRSLARQPTIIKAASNKDEAGGLLNGSKPFGTKWPWQFRAKDKPDVEDKAPWLLMAVKLAHYFTLVAQGTLSYVLFAAGAWLTSGAWHVGGVQVVMTQLEAFLLVLGSVYQAAAGGFFIQSHEYDGWEIGHFAMPDNTGPNVDMDNNDRLRLVSYQLLWMFQAAGMGMAAFGLQCALSRAGLGLFAGAAAVQSNPLLMGAAATALVVSWFTFAAWEPNFSVRFAKSKDAIRSPIASMVVFILAATAFALSIQTLVGPVTAYSAVACFALGGLCEAFLAEGLMQQRWHLLAVTVIATGSLLLILGVCNVCGVPFPLAGAGGVGLSACGWWYVMLAGVAAVMMSAARKMPPSSSA